MFGVYYIVISLHSATSFPFLITLHYNRLVTLKGDWAINDILIAQPHLFPCNISRTLAGYPWCPLRGTCSRVSVFFVLFMWKFHPEAWEPQLWQHANLRSDRKCSLLVVASFWSQLVFLNSHSGPVCAIYWLRILHSGCREDRWAVFQSRNLCEPRFVQS